MSFIIAIVVFFLNGVPVDYDVIGTSSDLTACVNAVPDVIEKVRPLIEPKLQIEVKCIDYSAQQRAGSAFGTKGR